MGIKVFGEEKEATDKRFIQNSTSIIDLYIEALENYPSWIEFKAENLETIQTNKFLVKTWAEGWKVSTHLPT